MIQVYTGCGKGKTTAALGLALRASGAGLNVYIGQFMKGKHYSELNSVKKVPNIKLEQFGAACFIRKVPKEKDKEMAKSGLQSVQKAIASGKFDMVILDEVNVALHLQLLQSEDIIRLIKNTPRRLELVLTGRYASPEIIKLADLVSEIKEVKHYYRKGTRARRGIES
jgi:cob(I)alamin adenosyltransferase